MIINPVGSRILVEIPPIEEKTKGGLFIPTVAQGRSSTIGKVVAIGTDTPDFDLKVGDEIMYDKFAGLPTKDEDDDKKEYLILTYSDVVAVIRR